MKVSSARPNSAGLSVEGELLEVTDLCVSYPSDAGVVKAVDKVSFTLSSSEVLAVIGESGSGKTAVARAVMGLIHQPRGEVTGSIRVRGEEVLGGRGDPMRAIRGREVAMVFQDPFAAFDPCFTVGAQIAEMFRVHMGLGRAEARARAVEVLSSVGIPAPERRARQYPHQLSGGLRQRAFIAMAIALSPAALIADEPTSAVDTTVQAEVLLLLKSLRSSLGMSMLFITHNLAVAANIADRIMVMYAGRIVEIGTARDIYRSPRHPYTRALLNARLTANSAVGPLKVLNSEPSTLRDAPRGCAFYPRCPVRLDLCVESPPALRPVQVDHRVACHLDQDVQ